GADFPKGIVKRTVELALPRAALVRGKITEAGSDKPVAGAYVAYNADFMNPVVSGADGSFKIAVAGNGLLAVAHPSGEFIPQIHGSGGGTTDKPIGDPSYYHAVVALHLNHDQPDKHINIPLPPPLT